MLRGDSFNSKIMTSKIHLEAQKILTQTKILKTLSKFGNVRIGGSFYTDLMFDPDIDISVASANPRKSAREFLQTIVKKRIFQKYQYGDFEKFPRKNRPKAHIVVLILPFNSRQWEIEIWFVKKHNSEQIVLEEKLKNLSAKKKAEIVKLKVGRAASGMDKHALSSFEIYQNFI